MARERKQGKAEAEYDLDEDLFNFDEVMPEEENDPDGEIDLDEIFAAFQEAEDAEEAEQAASAEEAQSAGELMKLGEPEVVERSAPAATNSTVTSTTEEAADEASKATPARRKTDAAPAGKDNKKPTKSPAPAKTVTPVAAAPEAIRTTAAAAKAASTPFSAPLLLSKFFSKGVLAVFLAMTLVNLSVAIVTIRNADGMKGDLENASKKMAATAADIREEVGAHSNAVREQFSPVVPPTPDQNPTFDQANAEIETGNFAKARQRIYAVLAVADRLPEAKREDFEARASFILARSYQAQAVARGVNE